MVLGATSHIDLLYICAGTICVKDGETTIGVSAVGAMTTGCLCFLTLLYLS